MDSISPVSQTLSPIVSQTEASAAKRLADSFGKQVDQVLAAAVTPNGPIGTHVDVKA